ncbi:MAG: phosphoglycerate dehydrogenase [Vampirovibrionales bacterium]
MPSRHHVLITDGIHQAAVDILQPHCEVTVKNKLSADELTGLLGSLSGMMVRSATRVTDETIAHAPGLKIIGRAGVGTDNIDLKAATRHGIIVVNSPGGNTEAAAEHTIGMIFALARRIPVADKAVKAGGWRDKSMTGVELRGKTLGIVGFGKIGRRVARVFQRVGMTVLVHDPFLSESVAQELNVTPVELAELYAQSDFITLHAPKLPETEKMLNTEAFAQMKDGVRLVNCARGSLIDETALAEAIGAGKVAGAALDVFDSEPPALDTPLFTYSDQLITTPHLGASTEEAQINVAVDIAEQFIEFFEKGTAQNAVNIPALRYEFIEPVKAYLPMAEVLGNFIRQLSSSGAVQLELTAHGDYAQHNLQPVLLAALKGFLSHAREGVNYVNALLVAEEEGIAVKESRAPKSSKNLYTNLLTLTLTTDKAAYSVSGSVLSDEMFRIVEVNGYPANLEASRYLLLCPHTDQPGMVGQIANILGQHHINISAMDVARQGQAAGGESIMIFNLDDPVGEAVLEQIKTVGGVLRAKFIELPV